MYKALGIFIAAILFIPLTARSQNSSINTFSPYTFYGMGEIQAQGTAAMNGMGGVGVASWSPYAINMLNPAAYSAVMRNSFVFGFGMAGKSNYLKSGSLNSSYNSFNMNDVGVMMPLAKGVGFGFSVSPFSSVGYRVESWETDPSITTDLGLVKYKYNGEGGISQVKAGIGFSVAKGLSVGIDLLYYLGTVSRSYGEEIIPVVTGSYGNISALSESQVSSIHWAAGLQYDIIQKKEGILTFGAAFQPKMSLRNKNIKTIASSALIDYYSESSRENIKVGAKISTGLFYRTEKLSAGVDYIFQGWKKAYPASPEDGVSYKNMHSYKIGVQYTPNRNDIRHRFNRWTYRAGFRYTDTYLRKNGKDINDMAVTVGVGIPLRMDGFSELSLGLEAGRMGTNKNGLIRDNYLKVSAGLTIVSNRWFEKHKIY